MKHYGDITKLSGWTLPIVDVITGGSPCQDLSVAGKRAGLDGERSGLFMDQIRIVKEMRARDRKENGRSGILVRPRYMVWENVPGAFSSNGGKDFQAVLSEIVRIAEPEAPDVPLPDRGGWSKSGCLYDELGNWSVAYRVHDAQFWGVPQRRKRIALLADFNGLSAAEILFDAKLHGESVHTNFFQAVRDFADRCRRKIQSLCKGLSGDSEPCGTEREGTAEGTEDGVDGTGWGFHEGTYYMDADVEADPTICLQGNGIDRADTAGCNGAGWRRGGCYTLNTIDRPAVLDVWQSE